MHDQVNHPVVKYISVINYYFLINYFLTFFSEEFIDFNINIFSTNGSA